MLFGLFQGCQKLLPGSNKSKGGGNEKYTSLSQKKLSWENRTLAFLTCDFRIKDKESFPQYKLFSLKNICQSFE